MRIQGRFFLLALVFSFLMIWGSSAGAQIKPVDLSTAIAQVAGQSIPAVVAIQVTERQEVENPMFPFSQSPFFRHFFNIPKMPRKFKQEVQGLGSGMIIDSQGHILTNYHVAGDATKLEVTLANGDRYPAKLVGGDYTTDLAVIRIEAKEPLTYLKFGDSDKLIVGEWVVAIGSPRALEKTVTQGIISAMHRRGITDPTSYEDFLQTDAALNPGNSGGPLLNLSGEVVGVNSAIATESGGFEGIGFTIPSNMASYISKQLIAKGKVERAWLGVSIRDLTPEMAKSIHLQNVKGSLVVNVVKGGPADRAGIKKNDVIVGYQDKEVPDSGALTNDVSMTPIGQQIKMAVLRDGKREEYTVKTESLDEGLKLMAASVKDRLGAEVRLPNRHEVQKYGMEAHQGVVITSLDPNGPLKKAGFEVGDMILAIDDIPVDGIQGFVDLVSALKPNQKVTIQALDHRTGNTGDIQVALGAAHHMRTARESFLQKNFQGAAASIRASAEALEKEADQAPSDMKTGIMRMKNELKSLAEEVEKGAVASVRKLDEVFSRAYRVLTGQ